MKRTGPLLTGISLCLALFAPSLAQQDPLRPDASAPAGTPRQIAPVMSFLGADWLIRPEREREERPDLVVEALRIPRGATVIDLGAGVGYFTWRLANQVGPEGRVIATDVQPEMLAMLRRNMRARGIRNFESVLVTQTDARLPADTGAELALLVDVYHELSHPALTMRQLLRALKPGGRVVLVEYRQEDPSLPIHPLHKMSVEGAREEIEPVGFEFVEVLDFLPSQHIIVFRRPAQ